MNTHREPLPTLFFLTLFLFTPALALAIPTGIQGFAASAGVTGGQGGRNIVVTNLNFSGAGSLKDAIEASGARYITFTPGLTGTINFTGSVYVNSDNMTVDGSGANISISGYSLNIFKGSGGGARNVIIHNLTFTNTTPDRNAISLEYGVRDVWIDHNTFKANSDGGIGQGVAVWARSVIPLAWTGITISWNHFKLPNKKALLIGSEVGVDGNTMKVSLHHNWFEGIASRSPRIHHHAIVHMWNNYSNNWSEYAVGAGDKAEVLLENNSFENGASRYAVSASYGGPSNSVNATRNLLLGNPLPVIETLGTFPRWEINYSVTPEVADNALKQRVTKCAGASITVFGTDTRAPPPPPPPPPPSTSLPDVVITMLSYASGVFTSTVKNEGIAATPAGIAIGVGYSVDGAYRTWGAVNGPLAAGASVTIGTNGGAYTIPTGTHSYRAYVDDANRFAESDETNNQLETNTGAPPGPPPPPPPPGPPPPSTKGGNGDWFNVNVTTGQNNVEGACSGVTPGPHVAAFCDGVAGSLVGTAGNDVLVGTAARDIIAGLEGDDVLQGLGGNDLICGGPGNDLIRGGAGRDRLLGERGRDNLQGEAGRDVIEGGPGNDKLNGGGGADICKGGVGRDSARGCERVSGVP